MGRTSGEQQRGGPDSFRARRAKQDSEENTDDTGKECVRPWNWSAEHALNLKLSKGMESGFPPQFPGFKVPSHL